ncbi:MAG: hypothetical protein KF773_27615 [Deltaproteobacteria bacterium]|nr:hypothetical protein [Deltaproteobacteria bacterium]MCW5803909.1 hypothetical protein [Deltaproteobacteria bacterium]
MRFHVPSFLAGVAVGAGGATLAPRLRPIVVEIAADVYRALDAVMLRVARGRENFSDLLAEARALARRRTKKAHLKEVA